jgi:hypothetical protein
MMELCEQVQTTNIHASDPEKAWRADFGLAPRVRTTLPAYPAPANRLPAMYNNSRY